jgi:hypothetical protein
VPMTTFENWGDALLAAFTTAMASFFNAIPAILGAILLLIVGWILSSVLASLVQRVVRGTGVDRRFAHHGGEVYGDAAQRFPPSRVLAELVRWGIRLVFIVAAANALNLPQVSAFLNAVLLWLPNLFVAIVILLVAPLLGRFLRGLIETGAGSMGFGNARLLGRLAEIAVIAFAVLIAVDQLGIAANILNILVIGVIGALALAFGLAFGLGGRDVAADLTRTWYEQSQSAAERIRSRSGEAAEAASRPTSNPRPVREARSQGTAATRPETLD